MASLGYNHRVESFRDREYPMLKDCVYLDHAGTTVQARSLMERFAKSMSCNLYGNPHSGSWPSQLSTTIIENVRLRLLQFFGADPDEFDLVFVANATAGVKLVTEAVRAMPGGFSYAYHQACHTSLVGVREEARQSRCLDDVGLQGWIRGQSPFQTDMPLPDATLFAYTAQSHLDGRRYPLTWTSELKQARQDCDPPLYTLLDVASFAATSPVDLSQATSAPDFVVLSLYKIFGFPDIGALLVHRRAEHVFAHKKYFGGGTVDLVTCGKEEWHAPKNQFLHERLEDGTLPFHSIIALDLALDIHGELFTSMGQVSSHASYLAYELSEGLSSMRHANGQPVCVVYSTTSSNSDTKQVAGPVVAFNLRNSAGAWISLSEFEKLAILKNIHVRTGGVCSPGGVAAALQLEPWEVKRNFSSGFRCGTQNDIMNGKPTGVIRASLGAMSVRSDVDKFLSFINEFYRDLQVPKTLPATQTNSSERHPKLEVRGLTVYPIKSCGGFDIPRSSRWEIRPEGLAWDREWCLLHRGTGQGLNQKRYPKMALLCPSLDFEKGLLRVTFRGSRPPTTPEEVSVPLSNNPFFFETNPTSRPTRSRVCGDEIAAQTYKSTTVNDFFSTVLGVPCVLARFPPGGEGRGTRYAKSSTRRWNVSTAPRAELMPGSFPLLPSPPDSDSDSDQKRSKLLLSNESPMLVINSSSVDALNQTILANGGPPVSANSFRANIIVGLTGGATEQQAYREDNWTRLRVGGQILEVMGGCGRCQMVCIDQANGEKGQEPFLTLAKTRRFDGKVYFGVHTRHSPPSVLGTMAAQHPTIQVGDVVEVEDGSILGDHSGDEADSGMQTNP